MSKVPKMASESAYFSLSGEMFKMLFPKIELVDMFLKKKEKMSYISVNIRRSTFTPL